MRFDRLHRGVTALTVLIGFTVLYLSGEFAAWVMGAASLAVFAGFFTYPLFRRRAVAIGANAVIVMVGLAVGYQAFATGNFLYYTIVYAVFLGAVKALMLRDGGDFMQMYALSFLHLVAGAVINPGLSFGVAMFPYVVGLTLGLMLTNLRRGIEAGIGAQPGVDLVSANLARKDLIRPGFLSVTVGVTAAVFVMSVAFFFLFPRMGLGFFATQSRMGIAMTGFSDTVTLGDFGNIVEDPAVVMRVKLKGRPTPTPLRMRGQSLDEYDGKGWRKTTRRLRGLNMDSHGRHIISDEMLNLDDMEPIAQEIYLEPMVGTPRVLFGMPDPVAFKRPPSSLAALRPDKWRFYRDDAYDVSVTGPPQSSILYTAYSIPRDRDPALLEKAGSDYSSWIRTTYTQLPEMNPAVGKLAVKMAGDADNPFDKAVAIENALRNDFTYALDTQHGEQDPLTDFLLYNRKGHCEYFASAMVVLLRSLGIPSRIVNGFYGGESNEYGGYVYLRKADAHSWVEVWFPGVGWITFDPTPAVALDMRADDSWWRGISDAVDNAKLWWYRWVVEYDLEQQVEFVAGLFRLLDKRNKGAFSETGLRWKDLKEMKRRLERLPWATWAGAAVGIMGLLVLLRFVVRKRLGRHHGHALCHPGDPAVRSYRRMLRLLARRGLKRSTGETQLEFMLRVSQAVPDVAGPVREITWSYLRAAWSPDASASKQDEMDRLVAAVRRGMSGSSS
ncbi:MAG: DUF3488 domain-containing protein [Deltaproteobacteria bacterium]|nr:DUF3488 domain-containing protein [Deltaproteobacteria bacterium]